MRQKRLNFSSPRRTAAVALLGAGAMLGAATSYASPLQIDDKTAFVAQLDDQQVTITGKGELHVSSKTPMLNGSTVNLADEHAMFVLLDVLPSEAIAQELYKNVTIDGRVFDPEKDRLAIYGTGCAFMARGYENPLTIYSGENFQGESMTCQYDIYYTAKNSVKSIKYLTAESLEDFDNNIRSFKLNRGFAVCFANNPDGTGHSRVFVADDDDLEIATMPEGLEFASFVRVCRNDWYAKRGICNGGIKEITRSTWYYDWGAGNTSTADSEFIPMKHDMGWDSWERIGNRTNTSAVLSFNEPDHTDQANMSVSQGVQQHPEFFKFGLRIGSPAPDNVQGENWLKAFIACCDSLNYRVDFVAAHMYWDSQDPATLVKNIEAYCKSKYGHRPMWITEWNHGANWTKESWPTTKGTALDANFNPLIDANGKQYETNRPHSKENSAKMCEWLPRMLEAFENTPWVERHAFYNWVEDARSIVINRRIDRQTDENGDVVTNDKGEVQWNTVNELTPAGKLFIAKPSKPGYDKSVAYVHEWRIAPPYPKISKVTNGVRLTFYDHNGETGTNYIIERKAPGGTWTQIANLEASTDYRYGKNVTFTDQNFSKTGKHQYRIKAVSYKGKESIYSRIMTYNVSEISGIDEMTGEGHLVDIRVENGALVLNGFTSGVHTLYSIDGKVARVIDIDGETRVEDLAKGIYIIDGIKVRI